MTIQEFYNYLGVDSTSVFARFAGNGALVRRFLLKFKDEGTFSELEQAVKDKDYDAVFLAAHTLKGVCGNLGLDCLQVSAVHIVDLVRAKEYDMVSDEFVRAKDAYERIQIGLRQLDE